MEGRVRSGEKPQQTEVIDESIIMIIIMVIIKKISIN